MQALGAEQKRVSRSTVMGWAGAKNSPDSPGFEGSKYLFKKSVVHNPRGGRAKRKRGRWRGTNG